MADGFKAVRKEAIDNMHQREFLLSIQYLRGLAAISVIVWHTGWARTVLGQVGVDIFFVISGFIMMHVSEKKVSPLKFFYKRLIRIAPLYWIITFITFLFTNSSMLDLLKSIIFWPDGRFPVVLQGWTLNLEMSYYFLFSMVLFFPLRFRIAILSAIILLTTISSSYMSSETQSIMIWSSPLATEFLSGMLLFIFWRNLLIPESFAAWLIGGVALLALAKTISLGAVPEAWSRILVWGAPSLLLVSAGLGIERSGQLPRLNILIILGESSYSIYLTHYLLIGPLVTLLIDQWAPIGVFLIMLLTSIFGILVHYFIEKPLVAFTNATIKKQ